MLTTEFLVLLVPAFIAGLLTFLAPCTFPLVPGYLAFISGSTLDDLEKKDTKSPLRTRVVLNGFLYVVGFTFVFVVLGTAFSYLGFVYASYRIWMSAIGGVIIILFGLYMMHAFEMSFLQFLSVERRFRFGQYLAPGTPSSSFLLGVFFASGWTPCVGPILGSVLILTAVHTTLWQGVFLLFVFSLGLAVPFLLTALFIGHARQSVRFIKNHLKTISFIGGLFLLFMGILMLTNSMALWFSWSEKLFHAIGLEWIYDYL